MNGIGTNLDHLEINSEVVTSDLCRRNETYSVSCVTARNLRSCDINLIFYNLYNLVIIRSWVSIKAFVSSYKTLLGDHGAALGGSFLTFSC